MIHEQNRWSISRIELCDFLGFQGQVAFSLSPGLQVLEAPNHTGKTSLAMGLLWGLTGVIPKLDRLNLKSFRLWNRHAGENAATSVVVVMKDADGLEMVVRRQYAGRTRDAEGAVELTLGDTVLTDSEANLRILEELGVKTTSLEGCGVVLQDNRLKLVTGRDSDVSEIVNDMLGLEALSEVVPVIEDMASAADGLRKEIDAYLRGGDPLQRWQEEDDRLAAAFRTNENEAVAAGFEPPELEDPGTLVSAELTATAGSLGADAPTDTTTPRQEIERLRKALERQRSQSAGVQELTELGRQQPRLQSLVETTQTVAEKWVAHDAAAQEAAQRGPLDPDSLARQIAELDDQLTELKTRGEENRGQQQLLSAAYGHLLAHPETESCPLCQSKVSGITLRREVKERLDVKLAVELEQLESRQKDLRSRRKTTEGRLRDVKDIAADHGRLLRETEALADEMKVRGLEVTLPLDERTLLTSAETRNDLLQAIHSAAEEAARRIDALTARETEVAETIKRQEESTFQPIERRLNRTRDALIPLLEAAQHLERHGRLRDEAERRSGDLEKLQRESRDLAGRLKKIAGAVSEAESDRATAAVKACLPFVSDFFAKITENPDFTGLDIQTTVTRNKVTYSLRATSSRMSALGDVVGHVLSEGDMSAAGMALLLGLASGQSHRLGFILLDDPAQGMDPALQRNFAQALAKLDDHPQVIVLTHQPDFAAALAAAGAERQTLGRWQGGHLRQ